MKINLWCMVFLAVLLCGCGGSGGNGNTGTGPLGGNWQMTANSQASGSTFTGIGPIQQNGNSISGTMSLSGSPCATSAALSGSISGTTLTLQLNLSGQQVNLTGTVNSADTSISGNYAAPSGGCTNGDFGTWSATKE
jgi:hypothetical protein